MRLGDNTCNILNAHTHTPTHTVSIEQCNMIPKIIIILAYIVLSLSLPLPLCTTLCSMCMNMEASDGGKIDIMSKQVLTHFCFLVCAQSLFFLTPCWNHHHQANAHSQQLIIYTLMCYIHIHIPIYISYFILNVEIMIVIHFVMLLLWISFRSIMTLTKAKLQCIHVHEMAFMQSCTPNSIVK